MDWKEKLEELDFESMLEEQILFPFVFSIYFVLSVYQHNIEQVPLIELIRPLFIAILGTGIAYGLLKQFIEKEKAGFIILFSGISFTTYSLQLSYILSPLEPILIFGIEITRRRYLILANIILLLIIFNYLLKKDFSLREPVKIANMVTIILLLIVGSGIATSSIAESTSDLENNLEIQGSDINNSQPSIYYIIPDKYARSDVLNEQYNFDNSLFLNSLEEKNFSVEEDSYTNYPSSYASLSSSLNMQYLQDMGVGSNTKQRDVATLLQDHQVQKFLKSMNYSYHHIGLNYRPTAYNENADNNINLMRINFGGIGLNEFETNLLQNTPVIQALNKVTSQRDKVTGNIDSFREIQKISKRPGKKFVFAHTMIPHQPYVLDEDLNKVSQHRENLSRREKYVQQVKGTNNILNETVEKILENEENPIIIIQSDEGSSAKKAPESFSEADNEYLKRRTAILFSHHTPEINNEKFHEGITPVNIFRVIFNEQFKTELEILEDKTYYLDGGAGHQFFRVNTTDF